MGSLLILLSMKKAFFWVNIRLLQFSGGWRRLLARWDVAFCYLLSFSSRRKLLSCCILVDNLRVGESGGEMVAGQ